MTNSERQIELLENRVTYLKTLDRLLERNASFKEVSEFVMSPENEDVAEKKVFIQQLVSLMKLADELRFDDDEFDD